MQTPWDSGYGLMNPWGNAWGMQPQAVADTVVQEQLAPAMGMEMDGKGGFTRSVPGDPNNKAVTSQATKDRLRDSFAGSLTKNAIMSGIGTLGNYAAGMPSKMVGGSLLGGMLSPNSVAGVLGNGLNAVLGTQPQGWGAKAIANFGVPTLAGMALGPVGGIVGGLMGGVVADGIGDAFDMRSREDVRDDYEDQAGYFGGRMGYADRVGFEEDAAKVRGDLPNSGAALHAMEQALAQTKAMERERGIFPSYGMEPGGMGNGSRAAGSGWGGFSAARDVSGWGLGGRADEVARGALAGVDFGGFSVGGKSDGSGKSSNGVGGDRGGERGTGRSGEGGYR
jgi:hypothetical protein